MVPGTEGLRGFDVESRPVDDEDERENVHQEKCNLRTKLGQPPPLPPQEPIRSS